jgi:hypothetical protein
VVEKRKGQRLGVNAPERVAEAFQAVSREDVPVPLGLELRSPEEEEVWRAFTRARAREDWRDLDLILLHKIVRIECDLRKHQAVLERTSVLISNKRGTLIESPLLRVIDVLQRQQLAIIRSMSLNSTGSDPRTLNAQARAEDDARRVIQENGAFSLLAMPVPN